MTLFHALNSQESLMICATLFIITQYCSSLPSYYSCVISNISDSTSIKCWGWNPDGQLGYGDIEARGNEPNEMGEHLPTINLGEDFIPIQIAFGSCHNCVLSTSGRVKCWGCNRYGALGYGDTEDRGDGPNEMGNNLTELDLGDNF